MAVPTALLALGALLTLGGAAALVVGFRQGQVGRTDAERRTFRAAVAGLALGSLVLLLGTVLQTSASA